MNKDNNTAVQSGSLNNRETWGSRIGYIFSTLGMAVGVGALWRFPMMTGQYGGGAFVIAVIIITVIIATPVGWAESALGRKYRESEFNILGKLAGKWGKGFGYFLSIIPIGLLAYYPIIIAVGAIYLGYTVTGAPYLEDVAGFYEQVNDNKVAQYIGVVIIILLTAVVSTRGIKKGVEKACKVMLPLMLILICRVVVCVLTRPGISEGIKYYLVPNWEDFKSVDLWLAAAGMALFACGVGPGFLVTYGSYMDKDTDVAGDFLTVNLAQLATCLICGLAFVPSAILFGLDLTAGKGVLYQTLPLVFEKLPGGMLWFGVFLVALLFAGLSTTMGQMEIFVSNIIDALHISRTKAVTIVSVLAILIAIPCVWNDAFFSFTDNLIGNVMYCISAAVISVFLGWVIGAKKIREEWYNPTSRIKYGSWVDIIFKFISVPAFIYFGITAIMSLF